MAQDENIRPLPRAKQAGSKEPDSGTELHIVSGFSTWLLRRT